jgi:hypothetical protein
MKQKRSKVHGVGTQMGNTVIYKTVCNSYIARGGEPWQRAESTYDPKLVTCKACLKKIKD